jgi:hypothetical protein
MSMHVVVVDKDHALHALHALSEPLQHSGTLSSM